MTLKDMNYSDCAITKLLKTYMSFPLCGDNVLLLDFEKDVKNKMKGRGDGIISDKDLLYLVNKYDFSDINLFKSFCKLIKTDVEKNGKRVERITDKALRRLVFYAVPLWSP